MSSVDCLFWGFLLVILGLACAVAVKMFYGDVKDREWIKPHELLLSGGSVVLVLAAFVVGCVLMNRYANTF